MLSVRPRSQITNIISLHSFESSQTPNMGETAQTHTNDEESESQESPSPLWAFLSGKTRTFGGTFIPTCMLHSRCNPFTWVVVFGFCFVCAFAPVVYVQIRSAEWNVNVIFFFFFILNCNGTLCCFRFTWKINTKRKNYVNMWSSLTSSSSASSLS